MIKAVVFDFDGLIIDTETPWYEAFRQIYQQYQVDLPLELWVKCVGTGYDQFNPFDYLEACVKQVIDKDEIRRLSAERHARLIEKEELRPGVKEYLEEAKDLGFKIGLASSSTREWVLSYLDRFRLTAYFDRIHTADDVEKVKPDPELYLRTLDCFGLTCHEAVAFEDSPHGAAAAKKAGLYCVIVPNGVTENLVFAEYDLRLKSLSELGLADVIKRLSRE
jgi:HAD superfamily hydrolase (TIGR01509 family)